jgi:RNA polymerase-binding transcription factor DksA
MANSATKRDLRRLKEALENRRDELFRLRGSLDDSWKALQEKDVEFEETAAKKQMALGLEKLGEYQKREIEAIDRAMRRMETGDYGFCMACGKPIPIGRLEAIPWTPFCTRCATKQERGAGGAVTKDSGEVTLPFDYEEMSDDEMETAIKEELRNDGRVGLETLEIRVDSGVIHLEGTLPSENSHQLLLEILQDTMSLHEFEDDIWTDELLRQRENREPPPKVKKTEEEEMLQGEDINEDVFHSRKSGKPVSPPEELIPEKWG